METLLIERGDERYFGLGMDALVLDFELYHECLDMDARRSMGDEQHAAHARQQVEFDALVPARGLNHKT